MSDQNQSSDPPLDLTQSDPPLDLTQEDIGKNVRSVQIPKQRYSPLRMREVIRSVVALALVGLLFYMILRIFGLYEAGKKIEDIKDISVTLLTPLLGIVGTVLGFYYGTTTTESK